MPQVKRRSPFDLVSYLPLARFPRSAFPLTDDVVGETKRQGLNREGRVLASGCHQTARIHYKKIVQLVGLTVFIHNRSRWIFTHATRTALMYSNSTSAD